MWHILGRRGLTFQRVGCPPVAPRRERKVCEKGTTGQVCSEGSGCSRSCLQGA
jgi:hypothetical protein